MEREKVLSASAFNTTPSNMEVLMAINKLSSQFQEHVFDTDSKFKKIDGSLAPVNNYNPGSFYSGYRGRNTNNRTTRNAMFRGATGGRSYSNLNYNEGGNVRGTSCTAGRRNFRCFKCNGLNHLAKNCWSGN